jgi:tripartite-type tricarboxylate transporter receptor subunit TctC
MKNIIKFILCITTAIAPINFAYATGPDGYPSRPVTVIVPFAPGGGSDNIARLIVTQLSERTKGVFIIDNRPGAGTNIGNEFVARAKPDGQTLLFGQVTLSINPSVYKSLKYNVKQDFTPIAHIANSPTVLIASPTLNVKNIQELIAYGKANPDTLNFGSGGNGTSVHLAGELFETVTGVKMNHVPYKGSAPAMTDLIGGQIQLLFDTAPSALPHIKGGKVKPLAVTGAKRLSEIPAIPTFSESGVVGFDAPAWYGLLAPAGTPQSIVKYLNDEVEKILKDPETQKKLLKVGAVPAGGSPDNFGKFIQNETDRWSGVIKKNGITLD